MLQQIAPAYHDASRSQKQQILEEFVSATGYARKYALWLLHHAEEVFTPTAALRRRWTGGQRGLGTDLENAQSDLHKTLDPVFARHPRNVGEGWACAAQPGTPQPASFDERSHRRSSPASPPLHPPSRPFDHQSGSVAQTADSDPHLRGSRDEAKPGFLEVNLVTHCGGRLQGDCLYTITLTDVPTGWTECLPLLNRGRKAVLAALQRARMLFPFPILGLDTDTGGEFLNEEVAAYCVGVDLTRFWRGPKRESWIVEVHQKREKERYFLYASIIPEKCSFVKYLSLLG